MAFTNAEKQQRFRDRQRAAAEVAAGRGRPLIRSAAAILLCRAEGLQLEDILKKHWPTDRALETVVRAATTPATDANTQQLVALSVANLIDLLGPQSACRRLFELGLQFDFNGVGLVSVPAIANDGSAVSFIGQGSPIPVRQTNTAALVVLKPYKAATISVFTNEAIRSTTPNVELLVQNKLAEDIEFGIDNYLFDTNASSATRPAGIRNGINGLTPSAASSPLEAMAEDVAAVVKAVSAVAKNHPIVLCASAAQAAALRQWSRPGFGYEVLTTAGLADKTLLALATNTLASAATAPKISITDQAVVVFDDAPTDITTGAVAVAGGVRSLFQDDMQGLRVIADVGWILRSATGVAWLTATNW